MPSCFGDDYSAENVEIYFDQLKVSNTDVENWAKLHECVTVFDTLFKRMRSCFYNMHVTLEFLSSYQSQSEVVLV